MRRPLLPLLLLLGLCGIVACGDDERPPPGMIGPGGGGVGGNPRPDGGPPLDAPDAVVMDAGFSVPACDPIAADDPTNSLVVTTSLGTETITLAGRSADFDATDCDGLFFHLASSSTCDPRRAPHLVVRVTRDAIGSTVPVGTPIALASATDVQTFLILPTETGSVTLSGCVSSDATIVFSDLNDTGGVQGFQLSGTLRTCDGAGFASVDASFAGTLARSAATVCGE